MKGNGGCTIRVDSRHVDMMPPLDPSIVSSTYMYACAPRLRSRHTCAPVNPALSYMLRPPVMQLPRRMNSVSAMHVPRHTSQCYFLVFQNPHFQISIQHFKVKKTLQKSCNKITLIQVMCPRRRRNYGAHCRDRQVTVGSVLPHRDLLRNGLLSIGAWYN